MSEKIKMANVSNPIFNKACELANVKPTKRQFKKWERGEGAAHAKKQEAHNENSNPSS